MKKLLLLFLLLSGYVQASSWYVRPAGGGGGTGEDWNNAWSLSSINWGIVSAGDTIWMAGGSYTGSNVLTLTSSGTKGSPILVKRVLSGDSVPTSASGWSSSYDSQVVLDQSTSGGQNLTLSNVSYVTVDGRVASGILMIGSNSGGSMSKDSGTITGFTLTNCELVGPASQSALTSAPYGLNWAFGTMNNCTVDHCQIHQMCNSFREGGWNNFVVQYCSIHDLYLCNFDHNDICYTYDNNTSNVIWRYNTVYNSPSDGWMFESGSTIKNWYWYGNVIYNCVYSIIQLKGGSYGGSGPNASYNGIYLYNNVFGGTDAGDNFAYINFLDGTAGTMVNVAVQNNVFYNCENEGTGMPGVNSGFNAYFPSTVSGVGWPRGEQGSIVLSQSAFVSASTGNFAVTPAGASSLSNGTALATDGFINTDMSGATRGNPWTIGAYQGSGPGPSPTPTITPVPSPTPSTTPTPSPSPTAAPSPSPSSKFAIGSTVSVTAAGVNVRSTPAGALTGTQASGATGTVNGGPTAAQFNGVNVNWWNIAFANGTSGWSGEDNLALVSGPTPGPTPSPTATPAPVPTATPTPKPSPTPAQTFVTWTSKMNAYINSKHPSAAQLLTWIKANPPTVDTSEDVKTEPEHKRHHHHARKEGEMEKIGRTLDRL
jgi:hypothetical protein